MYVFMYVALYCDECVYVATMFLSISDSKTRKKKKSIHGQISNSFEVY
jgi:hypothetical protein